MNWNENFTIKWAGMGKVKIFWSWNKNVTLNYWLKKCLLSLQIYLLLFFICCNIWIDLSDWYWTGKMGIVCWLAKKWCEKNHHVMFIFSTSLALEKHCHVWRPLWYRPERKCLHYVLFLRQLTFLCPFQRKLLMFLNAVIRGILS